MLPNEKLYQFKWDFDAQKYVFCGTVVDTVEQKNVEEAKQAPKEYYEWYELETNGTITNTWKVWLRQLNKRANPEDFCKCSNCGKVFMLRKGLRDYYKQTGVKDTGMCPECTGTIRYVTSDDHDPEYQEIYIPCGESFDCAIQKLYAQKDLDRKVCIHFNGIWLYSSKTIDENYKIYTGMTRDESIAESERLRAEYREQAKREEQEFKAQIPQLIEENIRKGHEILDEKYWNEWDEVVPIRLNDLYRGMELGATLELVKLLNEGEEFEKVNEVFKAQGHSGMSYSLMKSMVSTFCDRGKEFFEWEKSSN